MLKRALLTGMLALAGIGIFGAPAQADHTASCDSVTGVQDVYLWMTGVTGDSDCTGEGCNVETGVCGSKHCDMWLVVVGSCE